MGLPIQRGCCKGVAAFGREGKEGKIYVLGSGETRKLRNYIEIIGEEASAFTGKKTELDFGAVSYGENQVMHLSVDIKELCKDTGFIPEVSFREGIRKTISKMANAER